MERDSVQNIKIEHSKRKGVLEQYANTPFPPLNSHSVSIHHTQWSTVLTRAAP